MMQVRHLDGVGRIARPAGLGIQVHRLYPKPAIIGFAHFAPRLIAIAVDNKFGLPRQIKKPQHVAGCESGEKRLFGVDRIGARKRQRHHIGRGLGNNADPAVKLPAMRAAVFAIRKGGIAPVPSDGCAVV